MHCVLLNSVGFYCYMHFEADPPSWLIEKCFVMFPQWPTNAQVGTRAPRAAIHPGFLTCRVKLWREFFSAREDRKPGWIVAIGAGSVRNDVLNAL